MDIVVRVLISFLIFFCVLISHIGDCRQSFAISEDQEYQIELEKRLQILNKPPVKTIITKETGDVFDCIPINEQPAFDHPALKNHKIQLRPTFTPSPSKARKNSVKLRGTREPCPDGTVPIKRTRKEDLIRSDKELQAIKENVAPTKKANLRLENKGKLHGGYGSMAVYKVSISDNQESSSEIRLEAGPPGHADVLSVGWKVSNDLNGDGLTRQFGYWHDGTNNKGCYNTLCPGFVQVDKEISINHLLQNLSVYGDTNQQYSISFTIGKNPAEKGNWWLYGADGSINIGYWPKELFPNLANGADLITWGGAASIGTNGEYPPMGSGHLPDGIYKDTAYFDEMIYFNSENDLINVKQSDTTINVDSPACYDLKIGQPDASLSIEGFSFMFGGPGGKCT